MCPPPPHSLGGNTGQRAVPCHSPECLSFCQAALRGGPPEQCAGTFSRCSFFCLSFPHFFLGSAEQDRHLRTRQPSPAEPEVEEGHAGPSSQPGDKEGCSQKPCHRPLCSHLPRAGHRAASSTNPLGLWPKRIAEGSNQGAVRGMCEGVGVGGAKRAPGGSSEPIGEVGA